MANLNKVMLIGRLTRDPEVRAVGNAQLARFGFAVNNRKYNKDTQQWDDIPVFIDCEAWDSTYDNGRKLAQTVSKMKKGEQHYIEGHLKLDTWTDPPDKGGGKRSALKLVVDNIVFLTARSSDDSATGRDSRPADGSGRGGYRRPAQEDDQAPSGTAGAYDDDIPFSFAPFVPLLFSLFTVAGSFLA